MSVRIFHTADIHIGKKFSTFDVVPDLKSELVERRFEVLGDMVDMANEHSCQLFVIAGDLFDTHTFNKGEHVEKVRSKLIGFEGDHILILPGNHDYCSEKNMNSWEWVEDIDRVSVLKETRPYELSIGDEKVIIYPGPCNSKISKDNKIDWIKDVEKDDPEAFKVGVAHGHLEGCSYDSQGSYYPMSKDDLEQCGMDVWLLGHVHVQIPEQDTSLQDHLYPGTPEQEGFKRTAEGSEKGKAWIIELGERMSAESIDTGKYTFIHEERTLNSSEDLDELKKYLESDGNEHTLAKLEIKGRLEQDDHRDALEYINSLRHDHKGFRYIIVEDDDLDQRIDMELVKENFSEGSFPYTMLESLIEEQDEISKKAAELGYDIFQEVD